jgi:hypothetical protein
MVNVPYVPERHRERMGTQINIPVDTGEDESKPVEAVEKQAYPTGLGTRKKRILETCPS